MTLRAHLSRAGRWAGVGIVVLLQAFDLPGAGFPEPAALPSQTNLPDALVAFDGSRVKSRKDWTQKRRPELMALFQHYMYGTLPPAPAAARFTVDQIDRYYFGGLATKKQITIAFETNLPQIQMLLVVPNRRSKPAPVFLGMNFCGNHAVVSDPTVPLSSAWLYNSCKGCTNNQATEASRGSETDTWAVRQTIERGYAFACFYSGDVVPDRADLIQGLRDRFPAPAGGGTNDFGAIAAWAWGYHRCVDYLVNDRDLNPKRVMAVGHSRNGKTALLAAAFDTRIALVIPLQAGCGGTSPNRGTVGESVKRINTAFPHWFNARYKQFNDSTDRMPFDQHALIALCAPRPVLLANAQEDQWANPAGQFEMLKAAQPAFRLAGGGKLKAATMPSINELSDGALGYYIRPGRHSMTTQDWKVFLDYADRQFGRP